MITNPTRAGLGRLSALRHLAVSLFLFVPVILLAACDFSAGPDVKGIPTPTPLGTRGAIITEAPGPDESQATTGPRARTRTPLPTRTSTPTQTRTPTPTITPGTPLPTKTSTLTFTPFASPTRFMTATP